MLYHSTPIHVELLRSMRIVDGLNMAANKLVIIIIALGILERNSKNKFGPFL
jgi:hypothetical protein